MTPVGRAFVAAATSCFLFSTSRVVASDYTPVDLSSYLNGNLAINDQLDPVGLTVGNTGTSVPFLTSAYGSNGYMGSAFLAGQSPSPGTSSTLTINLASQNITGQSTIYALLNNYFGTANANEYNVVLSFTNGTSTTYQSVGGVDTRDYNYNPNTTGTISSTTTNWWSDYAQIGTYYQRLDVREFVIPTVDVNLTVASLSLVQVQPGDPGFISGLTFSTLPPVTFNNSVIPPTFTNIVTPVNLTTAVGVSLNPVFDGGTLTATTNSTTSTAFSITANGGTIDAGGHILTFQGALSNLGTAPGALTIESSASGGQVVLAGANTYTGLTTISSGTLALTGAGSIAASSGLVDNGVFDISGASGAVNLTALTGSGSVNLGAGSLNLTGASGTFAGVIGGTGGVTVAAGQQALAGVNTYTGATTINAGTLALSGGGSIASSSGLLDNGTLDITAAGGPVSLAALAGNGTVDLGANALNLTNAAGTFAGVIGGTGGVTVAAGHQTLSGMNTYTGLTTIGSGTLAIAGTGSLTASSGVIDNGIFDISAASNPVNVTALTGNGNVILGAGTLVLTSAAGTFAGVIGGTGGVTVAAGQQSLSGTNTFSGALTLDAGATLTIPASTSLGTGTLALNGNSTQPATLEVTGTTAISNPIQLSGDPVLRIDAGTTTITSAIADGGTPGDLVKQGTGDLVLTAASTYTGPTSLEAGTLELYGSITSPVAIVQGAKLMGTGSVLGSVSNSGTVAPGTATATGILTVSGNYAQSATGALTLRVTPTNVAGSGFDQLTVGGTANLAGAIGIDNIGAAVYPTNQAFDLLHAAGGVAGTFTTVNYSGTSFAPDLEADVLYASNDVYLEFQSLSNRVFNTPTTTTMTSIGNFADATNGAPASLTKVGDGTLVLTGASTYTGPTTIGAGTLEVNGSIVSAVTVNSGATLSGSGTVGSVNNNGTVAAGAGTGVGTLTTSGNYTQASSATLSSRVANSGVNGLATASLLNVGGAASLNGTLIIDNLSNKAYQIGQSLDVLHSAAGVSGTFANVSYAGYGFADYIVPMLKYQGNDVYLSLEPDPSVVNSGRVYVANSFIQDQTLFKVLESVMTQGDPFAAEGATPQRNSWAHLLGNYGNAGGYDVHSEGLVAGQGIAVTPELTLGGAVSALWTSSGDQLSNVDGTTLGASAYGMYDVGNAEASVVIGGGHLDNRLRRDLPQFSAAARGDNDGAYAFAGMRAQYRVTRGAFFAVPDVAIEYLHTDLPTLNEGGADVLDLQYAHLESNLGRVAVGISGGLKLIESYGALVPWLRIGTNDRIGSGNVTNTETVGLYGSTQSALALPTAAFTSGVGIDLVGNSSWRVSGRWTGDFGSGTRLENFALSANYFW